MTDLVALPKPRFTYRETASIERQIASSVAGSSQGCPRLDHFKNAYFKSVAARQAPA